MRAEVASPTYVGGLWVKTGAAILDPGKLAFGLREAALRLGVRVYEHSAVHDLREAGRRRPRGAHGLRRVTARRVLLATSAYPALLRAIRRYIVPVYDYVLMTEPLSAAQRASIGWQRRQGIGDAGNQFHYYRLTADGRILFGGWDAVYRYGGPVSPRHDDHEPTFATLSQHFFHTFPQLGASASRTAGAARSTPPRASRSSSAAPSAASSPTPPATPASASPPRASAAAPRSTCSTAATPRPRACATSAPSPVPFPPEPLRYAVVQYTRGRLAAADRNQGRRGPWLRLLDRLGLGFDS